MAISLVCEQTKGASAFYGRRLFCIYYGIGPLTLRFECAIGRHARVDQMPDKRRARSRLGCCCLWNPVCKAGTGPDSL